MKKKIYGRQLSRNTKSRKALFRSLVRALVRYGKIKITKAKAKAIQPLIDKLVNLAKKGGVSDRRRVYALLGNDRVVTQKIFDIVKTNFSGRTSGFTRAINLLERRGDSSSIVRLEWVEEIVVSDQEKAKSDKKDKKAGRSKETKVENKTKKKGK